MVLLRVRMEAFTSQLLELSLLGKFDSINPRLLSSQPFWRSQTKSAVRSEDFTPLQIKCADIKNVLETGIRHTAIQEAVTGKKKSHFYCTALAIAVTELRTSSLQSGTQQPKGRGGSFVCLSVSGCLWILRTLPYVLCPQNENLLVTFWPYPFRYIIYIPNTENFVVCQYKKHFSEVFVSTIFYLLLKKLDFVPNSRR